jgi:anaerobic ribonucleoside-triphosphate reductase
MTAVIERPQTDTLTLREEERQRCEVWTRVMGYHRPVASFNIGKQGEFAERVHFEEAAVRS